MGHCGSLRPSWWSLRRPAGGGAPSSRCFWRRCRAAPTSSRWCSTRSASRGAWWRCCDSRVWWCGAPRTAGAPRKKRAPRPSRRATSGSRRRRATTGIPLGPTRAWRRRRRTPTPRPIGRGRWRSRRCSGRRRAQRRPRRRGERAGRGPRCRRPPAPRRSRPERVTRGGCGSPWQTLPRSDRPTRPSPSWPSSTPSAPSARGSSRRCWRPARRIPRTYAWWCGFARWRTTAEPGGPRCCWGSRGRSGAARGSSRR